MTNFCTDCGNALNDEARFCTNCGIQVIDDTSDTDSKPKINKKSVTPETASDDLFDRFATIHDLKDKEHDKFYKENVTKAALNVTSKIEQIKIDALLESAPELNEQKHIFITYIKSSLYAGALGGYEIFLAAWEHEGRPLDKFKSKPINEKLLDDWIDAVDKEYDKHIDGISDEAKGIILRYSKFRMEGIEENHKEELEALPHATFEMIEQALSSSIIWGYFIGIVESKYRYKTSTQKKL